MQIKSRVAQNVYINCSSVSQSVILRFNFWKVLNIQNVTSDTLSEFSTDKCILLVLQSYSFWFLTYTKFWLKNKLTQNLFLNPSVEQHCLILEKLHFNNIFSIAQLNTIQLKFEMRSGYMSFVFFLIAILIQIFTLWLIFFISMSRTSGSILTIVVAIATAIFSPW